MKKNLLLFICFISFTIVSYAQQSNMIFFTQNEEKFYLVLNGIQQNDKPLSNVRISGIASPMQYSVRVRFEKNNTIIDDKVTLQPSVEKTWIIQPKNGTYIIKFSGGIELTNDVVDRVIPSNQEEIIYRPRTTTTTNDEGFSMNINTGEESANISFNSSGMNTTVKTNGNVNSSSDMMVEGDGDYSQRRTRRNFSCNNVISIQDFRNELQRVSSQTTTAGRKLVAEKIAKANCLTSKQVYALCNQLSFNADKMSIAKYCYSHCYDPENYEEVYNCFPSSTSVRELDDYITKLGYHSTRINTPQPTRIREEEFVPGYTGIRGCNRPMNATNFNDAKNTIEQASFESTKFSTAKTILASNCITVSQVIEICKLFGFENTKIDFAKFAYSKTYDRANYYKVNVVFDYDGSKETLNKFIQNGGK